MRILRRARERAFTLIEIAVVLAITILLSAIAVPVSQGLIQDARDSAARDDLDAIASGVASYVRDTGALPATLAALATSPGVSGWRGPYVSPATDPALARSSVPLDPWGRGFLWTSRSQCAGEIRCRGADALDSGDDVVRRVDVTAALRARMLDELEILNEAVRRYDEIRLPASPLPASITALVTQLVDQGYLIGSVTDLASDPFGRPYVVDQVPFHRIRAGR